MAFVPGYKNDIYVSYAPVDDRPYFVPAVKQEPALGWVATLVYLLKNELSQKIGSDAAKVWFDSQDQRGDRTPAEQTATEVKQSALLILIMSDGYLATEACRDELRSFARHCPADFRRRVFIVEKVPLDQCTEVLPELAGLRRYRFWYLDRNQQPRTLGKPMLDPGETQYFRQVEDLARDIYYELRETARSSPGRVATSIPFIDKDKDRAGTKAILVITTLPPDRVVSVEYCVSYAWDDLTPEGEHRAEIVDRLCDTAEQRGIRILRDKTALGLGESISKFMTRIGSGDRVFVVLSDKYLKSPHCMFELFEVWRNSRADPPTFIKRVRAYTLPSAKVSTSVERLQYAIYWKNQYEALDAMVKMHGLSILGENDHRQFMLMGEFAHRVSDILATIADVLQPHDFDDLERHWLDDLVPTSDIADDVELRRIELCRFIEQQGALVLPEAPYPLGRAECEAALEADLTRSRLFVQLLGAMPGKRLPDVPRGYGWLQLDRAQRHGLRVLQWRSPELDLEGIESSHHRELLEHETVHATSFESFKHEVAAMLRAPQRPWQPGGDGADGSPLPRPGGAAGGRPLVFLNAESRHRMVSAQIRAGIGDRAVCVEPLRVGTAERLRLDFEKKLIECDGMVIVYADNAGWARAQQRAFQKLAPLRKHPVRAIVMFVVAASSKPEVVYLPEMDIINCLNGIGSEALFCLLDSLGR